MRANLVPRPRLVEELNIGLNKELILISAPAGSGKTTLVVGVAQSDRRSGGVAVADEADNDLARFLAYLAAAFQQVDEEIGASLLSAIQSPRLPAIEKVPDGLAPTRLLPVRIRLILVLNDYHLITETAIMEVMKFLPTSPAPPQLHLVLTTLRRPRPASGQVESPGSTRRNPRQGSAIYPARSGYFFCGTLWD